VRLRRKPPGDIAQAVIGLMGEPAHWTPGFLCVRHGHSELVVRHTGFFISAVIGAAAYRFEGRDYRAMDKAWVRLKKAMAKRRQAEAAQRLREALTLPPAADATLALPAETIEQVEARVRTLREAVLRSAASPIRTQP
jgi:hypothetical protein